MSHSTLAGRGGESGIGLRTADRGRFHRSGLRRPASKACWGLHCRLPAQATRPGSRPAEASRREAKDSCWPATSQAFELTSLLASRSPAATLSRSRISWRKLSSRDSASVRASRQARCCGDSGRQARRARRATTGKSEVPDRLGRSPAGLPTDRLHQILEEAVQVRSSYPAPHRRGRCGRRRAWRAAGQYVCRLRLAQHVAASRGTHAAVRVPADGTRDQSEQAARTSAPLRRRVDGEAVLARRDSF
jgi:hypothetical protein